MRVEDFPLSETAGLGVTVQGRNFPTCVAPIAHDLRELVCTQLGYLTLTALTASTSVLITIHPQMLDVMSMSQFLLMLGGILQSIGKAGAAVRLKWFRYLVTRYEPTDGPQSQMVGFMQALFPLQMLKHPMVKPWRR